MFIGTIPQQHVNDGCWIRLVTVGIDLEFNADHNTTISSGVGCSGFVHACIKDIDLCRNQHQKTQKQLGVDAGRRNGGWCHADQHPTTD
jgi:hypothetical protein